MPRSDEVHGQPHSSRFSERLHACTKAFFSGCGEEPRGDLYEDILDFESAPLFVSSEDADWIPEHVTQAPAWLSLIRVDYLQSLQSLLAAEPAWTLQFCSSRGGADDDVWITSSSIRVGNRTTSAHSLPAAIDGWRRHEQACVESEWGALQRQVACVSRLLRDRHQDDTTERPVELVATFDYRGNDEAHTAIWLLYQERDTHFILHEHPSSRGLNLVVAGDGTIVRAGVSPDSNESVLKE